MNSKFKQIADHSWVDEFSQIVIVADIEGTILEMNDKAIEFDQDFGGEALIGANLLNCHQQPARSQAIELLRTGKIHMYTLRKDGKLYLSYMAPWYKGGEYKGLVEFILEVPPHLIRLLRMESEGET